MGRGERRCTRKGGKCFGRVTEKITRGNENKCLVKREDRKAAAADKTVNTYIRYGREGVFFMNQWRCCLTGYQKRVRT